MKNKKIAFYIGSLAKGGAERVIVNLAEYFYSKGYQVYVVTKMKEKDEYPLNNNIKRIIADITIEEEHESRIYNLWARINKLRNIWKDIKPDIIISFIRKNNLMAIASSRFLKTSVVVSVRSNPERELSGTFMKLLSFFAFRFADGIVLQTLHAKKFFPKYLQKKAVILPNSLSPAFLSSSGCEIRKKEIVSVGRIDDNKNQKMLIDAFSEVAIQYPEWKVLFFGSGEAEKKLRTLVSNKKLEESVLFCGEVSDIQKRIESSSIFVLSSRQEGMPNALIEAMALGLAVISTDCPCGGPAELIDEGKNGILIPVNDTYALRNALIQLIEDEELRKELGYNASKIVDKLHPNIVNEQWEEYLGAL